MSSHSINRRLTAAGTNQTMYLSSKLLILVVLCGFCEPARILAVFPTPSISHQVVFRPLTQELAKRGHQVVIITTDPAFPKGETPANLTEVDVHDISYEMWREQVLSSATTTGKSDDLITQIKTIMPLLSQIFEVQMLTDQVQRVIDNRTNHFDLLLIEACVSPAISLSHVFKVPVILVSSFLGMMKNYDIMGAPMRPPLLYPSVLRQKICNLSLWDKVVELYHHYMFEQIFSDIEYEDNKRIQRIFGPETPTIRELENNVHLMLLNAHPIWDSSRPVPPSVVYMGGMHQKPEKELPKELKSYLDSSRHGVIYVSFGTNVDPASLPPERIQVMVRVFSELPYDVLWKWSRDQMPANSDNIRISKWLPQSDLLKHPKVVLFITQGGLQSTDEALTAGVPLVGMPMLGDQWFNVEQYVRNKIGLRQDLDMITEESFRRAIETVLGDTSYRENVVKLRNIMRDQPEQPLQRAVWWTEHVLRHRGAPHLRARVANMSWAEYLDLDLLALIGVAIVLASAAVGVALYIVVGFVRKYVFNGVTSKLKNN